MNIDILGVAESHLTGNAELHIDGYKWYGRNRAKNKRAWSGTGGVGFLVTDQLVQLYDITVRDDNYEDILWIHFKQRGSDSEFQGSS